MIRKWKYLPAVGALIVIAMTVGGCGLLDPVVCTEEIRAGLLVTVVDSVSGEPPASATIVIEDGDYRETLQYHEGVATGAPERTGTYRIEVTSPGYAPWIREDVRVTEDECHVETVELAVRLQPEA